MIILSEYSRLKYSVFFIKQMNDDRDCDIPDYFRGEYLETVMDSDKKGFCRLYVGMGEAEPEIREIREAVCCAAFIMKEKNIREYQLDLSAFYKPERMEVLSAVAEGICTGAYDITMPGDIKKNMPSVHLYGIIKEKTEEARIRLSYAVRLAEEQSWARDMVNAPGNMLRPMDFAREITEHTNKLPIECEMIVYGKLKTMGMNALTSIGGSSDNPPVLFIMRYRGDRDSDQVTGLVGKGVTCDTGGYCLKPAAAMMGIKGDMAGGAAVAAAVSALAANRIKANVTAVIPMCENRISSSSLVPGDVIKSFSGKKIEICNTDAEGRLILADAMSYIVRNEKVDRVIDIATLTGAVAGTFGFTTAGLLTDNEEFLGEFTEAYNKSGERYWRLPIFKEHRKMLQSKIADIKNIGKDYCGTITAGIFVQEFAEGKPWIHLDIAGTAWCDEPLSKGQPSGATGAGTTSLYYIFS